MAIDLGVSSVNNQASLKSGLDSVAQLQFLVQESHVCFGTAAWY